MTSPEMAWPAIQIHFDLTRRRPANGQRSVFGQAAPISLLYIVNGVLQVCNFTCVKSILLEVRAFLASAGFVQSFINLLK